MLSKSSLEWPAQAADHPSSSIEEPAFVPTVRSNDPLDAQAKAIDEQAKATDAESFDALWHARVGLH